MKVKYFEVKLKVKNKKTGNYEYNNIPITDESIIEFTFIKVTFIPIESEMIKVKLICI